MDKATIARINKEFRAKDESNLWPIRGKFNVTERAIQGLRPILGELESAESYEYALEYEISEIVNNECNW